ncbi:MAG: hypothetical protein ACKVU2_13005 [Saprospiraceae bacterium]
MPWRPILKFSLIALTLYFALMWAKVLPHPGWLPADMEPLTVIGGFLFSMEAKLEEKRRAGGKQLK